MNLKELASQLKTSQNRLVEIGYDLEIELDAYDDIPQDVIEAITTKLNGSTKHLAAAPTPEASALPTLLENSQEAVSAATTPKELADATGANNVTDNIYNDKIAEVQAKLARSEAIASAVMHQQIFGQEYWATMAQLREQFVNDLVSNYQEQQTANQARFESLQEAAKETQNLAIKRATKLDEQLEKIEEDINNLRSFLPV